MEVKLTPLAEAIGEVDRLTKLKTTQLISKEGTALSGFVVQQRDGHRAIVEMSCVRWLQPQEFGALMHLAPIQEDLLHVEEDGKKRALGEFTDPIREEIWQANKDCELHIALWHNPLAFRARMENIIKHAQRAIAEIDRREAKPKDEET
ncbi:hypothetical protein [Paraburkholderia sp. BCC1886]|uniref:hypothetical protein n=1 Tax=Paraburkholderia sp. BCC1886 TaxID=2562670 RepID=UPI001183770C|nr:hypothetical protein [Paraburkholderia sp. BCC1886]